MASNWIKTTLGGIADPCGGVVDGPFGSNLPASGYVTEGIPVIRGSNLSLGKEKFKQHEFVYISQDAFEKLQRSECLPNDIIFTKKGTLGQTGIIPNPSIFTRYILSSNQMRLRVDPLKALPAYIYYVVSSPQTIEKIIRDSDCTGVPKINLEYLRKFPVKLPDLKTQKAIAHILGSLDDKIELNRQMNETLEAMAQALFKSWFVDFDPVIDNALAAGNAIPDEFAERAEQRKGIEKKDNSDIQNLFPDEFEFTEEMGWIPKGWVVSSVGTEFNTVGGGTPSTKNSDFWENGDINWTTPKDLSGNQSKILLHTDRKITELGLNKISSGLLPIDTVLMSSRAPVGYLALAKVPVAINQGYIALKCEKTLTSEFAIQWADSIMDDIKQRAGGTTFAEISKTNFRGIPILVPSKTIIDAYSQDVKDLYNQITSRIENINTLANLRDTLLPKLMSGELKLQGIPND